MKKHELIKHAYDNYPKGTLARFKTAPNVDHISTGKFRIIEGTGNGTCVISEDDNHCFYASQGNEWAEIVKPKIAVKVENEKEFNKIVEYLNSKGFELGANKNAPWSSWSGKPLLVEINENAETIYEHFKVNSKLHYHEVIDFSDFAKTYNIKLPLLTSEDGVDLYEGDYCYVAVFRCNKWFLDDHTDNGDSERFEVCNNGKFINSENEKHFKDKQSALKWIEEQNPKETILFEGSSCYVKVDENGFKAVAESDERTFKFSGEELKQIYNAWQEHQPF